MNPSEATILSRGKEYSSNSYRIIFHLGVSDCIQLIVQFGPSIWHVMGRSDFHIVGNKYFGSILNAAWASYVMITLLLAVNRLITVLGGAKADEFFLSRHTGYLIAICWIWGFIFLIAYATPHLHFKYRAASMIWDYTGDERLHSIIRKISIYSVIVEISLTTFSYIVICTYLCYVSHCDKKKWIQNQKRKGGRRTRELRILVQAILIAGFALFVLVYWNFYWILFSTTRWILYSANLMWIVNGGVNPAIYLALNRSVNCKHAIVFVASSKTRALSRAQ
ncbi:unnamed protein product [Anisakis simplex]|uniref:G_PROTEIN_RECEP_F1_2 domain-containing protein n=1 Tax=Anisakis simplex TaxID=6269 RepID=A0A0M3JY80_ANISI|nr:unnamed protein product [Anisakis simplex]